MKQLLSKFGRWLVLTFGIYQVEEPYRAVPETIKAFRAADETVYVEVAGEVNYATPIKYSESAILYTTALMSSNCLMSYTPNTTCSYRTI